MAVTIEDLYRSYGVLADAKDNLSQVNKGQVVNFKTFINELRVVLFSQKSLILPPLLLMTEDLCNIVVSVLS